MSEAMTKKDVLKEVEAHGVKFVRLWFTDVLGQLKSVAISPAELDAAFAEGVQFDGTAIDGFSRVHESDVLARPDATDDVAQVELDDRAVGDEGLHAVEHPAVAFASGDGLAAGEVAGVVGLGQAEGAIDVYFAEGTCTDFALDPGGAGYCGSLGNYREAVKHLSPGSAAQPRHPGYRVHGILRTLKGCHLTAQGSDAAAPPWGRARTKAPCKGATNAICSSPLGNQTMLRHAPQGVASDCCAIVAPHWAGLSHTQRACELDGQPPSSVDSAFLPNRPRPRDLGKLDDVTIILVLVA